MHCPAPHTEITPEEHALKYQHIVLYLKQRAEMTLKSMH